MFRLFLVTELNEMYYFGQQDTMLTVYQPAHIRARIGASVTLHCQFNYTGKGPEAIFKKFSTNQEGCQWN